MRLLGNDGRGQFETVAQDPSSDGDALSAASGFAAGDVPFEEQEHDPSERRPGGAVVEAIRAMGPEEMRKKWLAPGLLYLGASLLQSIGLFSATVRYRHGMEELTSKYSGPHGGLRLSEHLQLVDNFSESFGDSDASVLRALFGMVAWAVPWLFVWTVTAQRNLRLWVHTLLTASMLAALMGLFAWTSVLSDAGGWLECKEHAWAAGPGGTSFTDGVQSVFIVVSLWIHDLAFGCRGFHHAFVCADSFGGSTYVCTLGCLGLYDAIRVRLRKHKPQFRVLYQIASGLVLFGIAIVDGLLDVVTRRQHTVGVAVASLLPVLLLTSPVMAFCTDRWMIAGSSRAEELKESTDLGDVVVSPCCFPFCGFHGRYFLFSQTADVELKRRAEEEQQLKERDEAARIIEQQSLEQQEAQRRIVELETQREELRNQALVGDKQDVEVSDAPLREAQQMLRTAHEQKMSTVMSALQAKFAREQQSTNSWEVKAQAEMQRIGSLEKHRLDDRGMLSQQVQDAARQMAEAREVLAALKSKTERTLREAEALRSTVVDMARQKGSEDPAAAKIQETWGSQTSVLGCALNPKQAAAIALRWRAQDALNKAAATGRLTQVLRGMPWPAPQDPAPGSGKAPEASSRRPVVAPAASAQASSSARDGPAAVPAAPSPTSASAAEGPADAPAAPSPTSASTAEGSAAVPPEPSLTSASTEDGPAAVPVAPSLAPATTAEGSAAGPPEPSTTSAGTAEGPAAVPVAPSLAPVTTAEGPVAVPAAPSTTSAITAEGPAAVPVAPSPISASTAEGSPAVPLSPSLVPASTAEGSAAGPVEPSPTSASTAEGSPAVPAEPGPTSATTAEGSAAGLAEPTPNPASAAEVPGAPSPPSTGIAEMPAVVLAAPSPTSADATDKAAAAADAVVQQQQHQPEK